MGAEDYAIGGIKNLENRAGIDGASNSVATQVIPQYSDYGQGRVNTLNNQTQFLRLTARDAAPFNSAIFDFKFGTTAGLNPYYHPEEHQGKNLNAFG